MLQFGMRAHDCCPPLPMTECFDTLAANGLRRVQLAFEKSISDCDFSTGRYSPGFAGKIGEELGKRGLHVSVLGCYINPVHPDEAARRREVDRFIERLRYAKDIGVDMVGTETGRFSPDMAVTALTQSEECWRVLLGSFSRIAREKPELTGLLEESSPAHYAQDCGFFTRKYEEAANG